MSTSIASPSLEIRAIGKPLERIEGPAKLTGAAPYAYEYDLADPLYLYPVQSTIARGKITSIDTAAAKALKGVAAVITHENATRLASDENKELWVLQSAEIGFRGQLIGAVIAETPEIALHAASLVRVQYAGQSHDAELRADRDDLYAPKEVNGGYPTDTEEGDPDAALKSAAVTIDHTYTTPMEHNNPMEPHTTVAIWKDDGFTLYDSTQGAHSVRNTVAELFGLAPEKIHVIATHVGGGFGSKGEPHAHDALVCLAAQAVPGRPVKFALTRQQMFSLAGYRAPTIQRIRLGADRSGRLTAIVHDVVTQTSRIREFTEQAAVPTRIMYAAPNRRTTHRLAALDVPVPSWMRAPGETPGMFATELAMDELAVACGLDPIDLRMRNEPEVDPASGKPWSCRNLIGCLREGARRFGWEQRDPEPGVRRRDGWLVGTGVASSTYPLYLLPGSRATIRYGADRRYAVRIGAADIGTGTWTALTQIAADALDSPIEAIRIEIGDTDQPNASVEGGSSGISSWGSTIVVAARAFRAEHGDHPAAGAETSADMPENPDDERFAMHSFGAQFAEVQVHQDTGEIRVARMLGVFSVGRIINPRTARSQFIGGMTMGLSMALLENSVLDTRFGHVVTHDFAEYHIAANADVVDLDAVWLDEVDPHSNAMGSRGIGEIGIVGAAAAIANAAWHATGIRVRDLPITADKFLA
ncbi:MAG TPA: xanthine dehydrogenase family protein molybdopterin-binding subunit [Bryobacteraceae bacterium]